MSNRYEFTNAGEGFTLDTPGSTAGGAWEKPLSDWGLGLGDAAGAALVIEDSLANLKSLLENALGAVNRRLELEAARDLREVTVGGNRYTVPGASYRAGMDEVEVQQIAVRVEEDVDDEGADD